MLLRNEMAREIDDVVQLLRAGDAIFVTYLEDRSAVYKLVLAEAEIPQPIFEALREGWGDARQKGPRGAGRIVPAGDGLFADRPWQAQTWHWVEGQA